MDGLERGVVDRRRLLRAVGAGTIAVAAGCLGDDDGDETDSEPDVDPEAVQVGDDATWRTASIADVTTDSEFRIAAFDRPVLVHTFTRGCAVCNSQQGRFADFHATAGDDVEIVELTIDPNADPAAIRDYADDEGFGWRFGSPPEQVMGSLVDTVGTNVTVSSASPVLVVCPDGGVYRLDKIVDETELDVALDEAC